MTKYFLQCKFSRGDKKLTAFVPYDKRIKVGSQVELKMEYSGDFWTVGEVSQPVGAGDIKIGWKNNI